MDTEAIPSITIDSTDVLLSDLKGMSRDEQIETMRTWFFERYEDPVERTPFESAEGGYIYIWGGPYDAYDELSIFSDYVPDDVIKELAHDLSMDCPEWTSAEKPSDYEDDYLELILADNEYFKSFNDSIAHINEILAANVGGAAQAHLFGLLYVSVITAVETYLSDAFINTVLNDDSHIRTFVEKTPEFTKKTFNLSEVFSKYEGIKDEVKEYLLSQLWHNIKKIKPMYKTTLNVNFPPNLGEIFKAINIRHDLVHRNGKSKDDKQIEITKEIIDALISNVSYLINHINEQLNANG
ncbi:HEPN domain-containing protein [Zooshikella harenae]|uniref:RiboL-PSP-HEPN domain-containing protein n=1 Tax=Zooshikella harenae TaxID=2827238 RepID=A0ABS5ZJK3_9GAMM|nr:HEPN domain-containing protein [Zooshikella harenae]MBU2714263.1 hypothetical protein [Zooshikella harenae]